MLPFTRHLKKVPKPPVYQDSQLRAVDGGERGAREAGERIESVRNPGGGTAEPTPTVSSTVGWGELGARNPPYRWGDALLSGCA